MNGQLSCKILIFEDDPSILDMLTDFFEDQGATVISSSDGGEALPLVQSSNPDIILLDVVLPNQDGFTIVSKLRSATLMIPVILMTEKSSIDDRVLGLDSGADDYVCKPFSPKELLARVKAQLRRNTPVASESSTSTLQFNDLRIDLATREVVLHDLVVPLTKTEFDLLAYLAGKYPEVITHSELYVQVLGYNAEAETKAITMHIMNLRKKFRKHAIEDIEITAVPGVGYKFALQAKP